MYAYIEKNENTAAHGGSLSHERAAGEYRTGIPTQFRLRMEHSTGLTFDDVRIHYNSERPAALQALAYTQGSQVYLGQGQEHCLPHELGHVVQQKLGVVRANASINGLAANTDERLEQEADRMFQSGNPVQKKRMPGNQGQIPVVQRFKFVQDKQYRMTDANLGYDKSVYDSYKNWEENDQLDSLPGNFIWSFMDAFLQLNRKVAQLGVRQRYRVQSSDEEGKQIWFTVEVEASDVKANSVNQQIWIDLPDYATGDQFTIAAMLLKRPDTNVRITQYKGEFKTCELWKTFKRTLESVKENTVKEEIQQGEERLHSLKVNEIIRVVYQEKEGQYNIPFYIERPGFATKIVGKEYTKEGWKGDLRKAWGLTEEMEGLKIKARDDMEDEKFKVRDMIIGACPDLRNIILESGLMNKKIFIIWFRRSGASGGAHLEHDTGLAAMRKLIEKLLVKVQNSIVILAGDKPGEKVTKLRTANAGRIFDLTEFWKKEEQTVTGFLQNDRFKQIKIYDFFAANAQSVLHIGSRSGNLELMALIGHQVNYIEEEGSYGGNRMDPFNDSNELYYKRRPVKNPLTFKGKLVRIVSCLLKKGLKRALFAALKYPIVQDNIMKIGSVLSKGVLSISDNNNNGGDYLSWLRQLEDSQKLNPPLPDNIVLHLAWFYEKLWEGLVQAIESPNVEKSIDRSKSFGAGIPSKYTNILYPMIHHISITMKIDSELENFYKNSKGFKENENEKKWYHQYRGLSEDEVQGLYQ